MDKIWIELGFENSDPLYIGPFENNPAGEADAKDVGDIIDSLWDQLGQVTSQLVRFLPVPTHCEIRAKPPELTALCEQKKVTDEDDDDIPY